jgi:signal transduction histidine kinase
MAKLKADRNIERSKEYIEQISTKSRRMIDAMDDMLWSLDPDNDYMEKTILRMRESAEALQHTYGTEIQIEIDEKVKSVKMDMRTRHELFLIFKEGLRTIASNSRSGTLVNADLSGGKLLVKIHNGGMNAHGDPEVERSYQELRQRAEVIGAELDIQTDKKGIFIVLFVPLK